MSESVVTARPGPRHCGAPKRQGEGFCTRPAGWGTDHVGQGRCKLHGGATPIKHGRYSKVKRRRIRELIATHADDPDPLDVMPELAAARALFQDYVERYDRMRSALLAWHASYSDMYLKHLEEVAELQADEENELVLDELRRAYLAAKECGLLPRDPLGFENKPRQILDVAEVHRLLAAVAKIAQAEKRLQLDGAISRRQLVRVLSEQRRILERRIKDERLLETIIDDFREIPLG